MTRHSAFFGLCAVSIVLLAGTPALAQRADENAIADAEDAFGSNDGGEDLGLYDPFNVRGFSPIDAGNVRLEGLYVDRQGELSPRLVDGNRIRVGPSAANYAFPAPSGVVDYRLRTPGPEPMLSAVAQANSFGGGLIEVDAALPINDLLSVGGGVSQSRSEYASGNNADVTNMASVAHWRLAAGSEATLFWSRTRIADEDIYPIILGDGRSRPPRLERRRFLGQHWADVETERFNYGALGQTTIGGFGLRAGVFRSINDVREGHNVFLQANDLGQLSSRIVSSYPGRSGDSTSGEIGIVRGFATGELEHRLQLLVRGRSQERRYGGVDRVELPPAPFGQAAYVARPHFEFSEQTRDQVRQHSMGFDYELRMLGVGRMSAGIQKVDYQKRVASAEGLALESRDAPWLFNAAAVVDFLGSSALYGSYTRGLEESDVAPESAVNRDESPPAIRTQQVDAGATFRVRGLTLITGVFNIERPYYGVDTEGVFRELGVVRHRGIEASLTGSPVPGLILVGGAAALRARVSGQEVASGAVGAKPIDVPESKLIASADWRPAASATSFDFAVERIGPNTGDALNHVRVAPYTVVNVGLRHRFTVMDTPAVLRVQATNLLNSYGWEVAGNNAFVYTQSRQFLARLTIDL